MNRLGKVFFVDKDFVMVMDLGRMAFNVASVKIARPIDSGLSADRFCQ